MSVLSAILNVFDEVSEWIVTAFQNMTPIFYNAETGLSFMGVLAVAGLSISVILLIIGIVQRFLKFGA